MTNKLVLGCRLGTADKDYEIVEKKLEIPKPGNNERYFANRIEEDPESLIKDEVLIKECNAPIAAKFAIEVLATQKDNKTQEVAEVEIKFVLRKRLGATKK